MLSFKQFISEQKIRQGLDHLSNLNHERLGELLQKGVLRGTSTRKTDGAAGMVGYDEEGFYTSSNRSGKIRNAGDYTAYTKSKRGEDADTSVSSQYDQMHDNLQKNPALVSYLKSRHEQGKPASIKGEFFLRGIGKPTEKGLQFVGTSYNPESMGKTGMFIMHHKLPENETHDPEHITSLGDKNVSFDHDKAENSDFNIDVSTEKKAHSEINPELLKSRKAADKEAKEKEQQKLDSVKSSLENKLKSHVKQTTPRSWEVKGESEGDVFHPLGSSAFKVTSDNFRNFKANQKKERENV